ncbi:MAG: alanine--tRNA ligase [Anaerolineae bacterium]|nr:alanine--tRNA ligase [Anaerolineae bacterium]
MVSSADIRSHFLAFFEQRGHTVVPSSSLIPANDPTLLFTNAGMVQFKEIYQGLETRSYSRAASSQKCMRVSGKHNDLDAVGPSPRHQTFFEMLGNFSFGDYFKAQAIEYAWAFLTREMGLPAERLYPTVYQEDDEAIRLWQKIAGLPAARITRLGKKDNFWEMGDTGPCGPCSEILYDRGAPACSCGSADCSPASECDRWLELWNLVFTQFDQQPDGSLVPLPNPNIDTGMGLERITAVVQGVDNNYDTDLFLPIMERTRALLGASEAAMRANLVPYRVIADHSRALAFLIADGILPGNEGRSYVLRMILRRAARYGKLLGFERPFLAEAVQAVIDSMGDHYTELRERQAFIREAITQEEERFLTTLTVGLSRLDELAQRLRASGSQQVPGEEAFRLYDTYGFPLELTRDAAHELGLAVDEMGFQEAMAQQRERARGAQRFAADAEGDAYRQFALPKTVFLGYESLSARARVLAIVQDGQRLSLAEAGSVVDVVLDVTPFYAEAGGQVGDTGELRAESGRALVMDTVRPVPETVVHRVRVREGRLAVGASLEAVVDRERRLDIARNHTATHLLHRALRQVLGEHAAQAGSLVAPDRLRFDFAHLAPVSQAELKRVSEIVNAEIRANRSLSTRITSYEAAVQAGVVALFGEKYGDQVRVVQVEGFSAELCGGTHLHATGQIGAFIITSESSIGSGLRRIEALTGRGAEAYVYTRLDRLARIADLVAARSGDEVERVETLLTETRELRRTVHELQQQVALARVDDLLDQAEEVKGVRVLASVVDAADVDTLRSMGDRFRDRLGSAVVALGALVDGRPLLIVALTQDLIGRGLSAGQIAKRAAAIMGGGGGGRPDFAQAGGKEAAALPQALTAVSRIVAESLH